MKKIKLKRNIKEDIFTFVGVLIFISMWGGLGGFLLYYAITNISTETTLVLIKSIINSSLLMGLVFLSMPLYFIFYYLREMIYPTRYIAKVNYIKKEQEKFKVEFEIKLKKSGKTTDLVSNVIICYLDKIEDLKENEEYLVKINGNNRILDIIEYDEKYGNIKKVSPTLNMGIVFVIILLIFFNILVVLLFNIFYNLYLGKLNNDIIFFIIGALAIVFLIYYSILVYKRFNSSTDIQKIKEREKNYINYLKGIKLIKNYGEDVIKLNTKSYIKNNLLIYGGICLLYFFINLSIAEHLNSIIILRLLMFSLGFYIICLILLYVVYIINVKSFRDNIMYKKYNINNHNKINITKIDKALILKTVHNIYVIDEHNNLLLSVRKNSSLIPVYYVGDSENKLISIIKNKTVLKDELIINQKTSKPYILERITYPTFNYKLSGIDYNINNISKLKSYEILDKENNLIASINNLQKGNSKYNYAGTAMVEINNADEKNLDKLLIALSIIISNLELLNTDRNPLVKADEKSITTINK